MKRTVTLDFNIYSIDVTLDLVKIAEIWTVSPKLMITGDHRTLNTVNFGQSGAIWERQITKFSSTKVKDFGPKIYCTFHTFRKYYL